MKFSKIFHRLGLPILITCVFLTSWIWAQVAADTGSKGNAPAPGQQPAGTTASLSSCRTLGVDLPGARPGVGSCPSQ